MQTYSLTNCTIITMDKNNTIYTNGTIVIENGKITNISNDKKIAKGTIYPMDNKIIMPGLINCHTHLPSTLYRGIGSDLELMDWLEKAMWPAQEFMSEQDSYWGSMLNCAECIQNGVTTIIDQYYYAKANAKAVSDAGLRAIIGATVFEHASIESNDTLKTACEFIEMYKGKEEETLIYPCFGPHAPYTESPKTYEKIVKLAKKYNVPIHTHIGETKDEINIIKEKYNTTPVQLLNSINAFDVPVISAHNIYQTKEDIKILKDKNVRLVYNPVSNLKLASGIAKLKPLIEAGITIGLGTDGAESNNSLDLLQDVKTGLLLQKTIEEDASYLDAEFGIRMMTTQAAKVAGLEDKIGKLEVKMDADIIALDLKDACASPIFNTKADLLYSALAYAVDGRCVSDTIVKGKWLMKDRKILTFDFENVKNKAQQASFNILTKAGLL